MLGPPFFKKKKQNKTNWQHQHSSLSEWPDQILGALDSGEAARIWLLSAHQGAVYNERPFYFNKKLLPSEISNIKGAGSLTGTKASKGRPIAPSWAWAQARRAPAWLPNSTVGVQGKWELGRLGFLSKDMHHWGYLKDGKEESPWGQKEIGQGLERLTARILWQAPPATRHMCQIQTHTVQPGFFGWEWPRGL